MKNKLFLTLFLCLLLTTSILLSTIKLNNPIQEPSERNHYGEILLGLNANPRPPTNNDIAKGIVKTPEGEFIVFESRELKDLGETSYWKIE